MLKQRSKVPRHLDVGTRAVWRQGCSWQQYSNRTELVCWEISSVLVFSQSFSLRDADQSQPKVGNSCLPGTLPTFDQRQLHVALHRNDNHTLPEAWHAMGSVIFARLSRSFSLIKFLYLRSIWQSCPHAHKQRSWLLTSDAWDGSSLCQFACPPKQLNRSFTFPFPWGALRWIY